MAQQYLFDDGGEGGGDGTCINLTREGLRGALLLAGARGKHAKAAEDRGDDAHRANHHELVDGAVLGRLLEDKLRARLRRGKNGHRRRKLAPATGCSTKTPNLEELLVVGRAVDAVRELIHGD